MHVLPMHPGPGLVPFAPVATRSLRVMGATVELVLVPERGRRRGQVADRPAMQRCPAARIIAEESFWTGDGLALTPNRYPFAAGHRILWTTTPCREPDVRFWHAAISWVEQSGGTALLNNIGSAATIARAHAHLTDERQPFLSQLPERAFTADLVDLPTDCELVAKDVPMCIVGVRGPAVARAAALPLLAEARTTACWNVVLEPETAWVVPRAVETPAPWFHKPLGAAELWGRWCYVDEQQFAAATTEDLEQALRHATLPWPDQVG